MNSSSKKRHFSSIMRDTNSAFLPAQASVSQPLRICFVLLEHFSMVAFTSAIDALVTANLVTTSTLFSTSTYGINSTSVRSDLGIDITANGEINQLLNDNTGQLDVLIVCGGFRCDLAEQAALSQLLRSAAKRNTILGGLWNGAVPLAHAGLINQRSCAIHPDNQAYMREHFRQVAISDRALVIDEKRVTSAGPSSALEMMLKLIEQLQDPAVVRAVREILSCDKATQGSEENMVNSVDDPNFPSPLRSTLQLMHNNIEEPLSIEELAKCIGVSRRRIERLFQTHLQTPPSRYYLELRVTHARRLLLQSNDSVANIAVASGFLSSTHFSHCFKDYFGTSPSQARQKHRGE